MTALPLSALRPAARRPLLALAAALLSSAPALAAEAPAAPAAPAAPVAGPRTETLGAGRLSTEANEYNAGLSADGRTLLFARSPKGDFKGAHILVATRGKGAGAAWGEPKPLPFADARYRDSDPFLAPDGRTLYFISDRPRPGTASEEAREDLDVWRVTRDAKGGWGTPEHLGMEVNSDGEELGPELHGDTLYFNSSRKGGPGQLDIWSARRVDGRFQAATVLPAPINSPQSEGDFTLSADGRVALFWSSRPGGQGSGDVWVAFRQGEAWGTPVNAGAAVNTKGFDFTPSLLPDGDTLLLGGMRNGALSDLYRVTGMRAHLEALREQAGATDAQVVAK
jgi:hypothetical protein